MAEFKIPRIRFTWKGDWSTATVYVKDEIVRYHGKSYVCLVGHTASADFNTDLNYIDTTTDPDTPAPKWVLWFDGYEWRNNWTPSTLYNLGDYVRYNSIIYICTISHTSSGSFTTGLEPDLAKWAVYASTDDWVKDWTITTRYRQNDMVRYGGTIYRCLTGHVSAGTTTLGLEANQAYWTAITYANDWKTDWAVSTRYKLGDVVRYGGIVYKCTVGHTSAATITLGIDNDLGKWTIVHNGIDYKFAWASGTRYKLNDIVKYGADLYICTTAHTSSATFSTANFTVWVPGLEFADNWDSLVSYVKGDVVTYGGYQYTSNTTNNLNNVPSVDTTDWTLLVKNYNVRGDWSAVISYRTGDLVRRDGYLYVSIVDSVNTETTNTSFWTLVNPGMHWRGPWAIGNTYVIGDVVTFYSTSYICLAKHDSVNPPKADLSNWTIYVRGEQFETLQYQGDIQTYNNGAWDKVSIGANGNLLKSSGTLLPVPAWNNWGVIGGVYYVAPTGVDSPANGTTISTPWKTIKYACQNITGPATVFVKTGTYGETLPISVPAGVALVGDELRGTVVQPARSISCIATGSSSSTNRITVNTTLGIQDNDPIQFIAPTIYTTLTGTSAVGNKITVALTAGMAVNMPIIFTGTSIGTLVSGAVYYIKTFESISGTITVSSSYNGPTVSVTTDTGTMTVTAGGFGNITTGQTYYVIGSTITPTTFQIATSSGSSVPLVLTDTDSQSIPVYGADAIKDMFYVRNGCGIRNMTLRGLLGGMGQANVYGTKRPTGGAFVSLDPGSGTSDTSVQITTKSPYVQNVTNFGQGCTGLKIDGSLHNGGNRSIVANDFTQIISDGIGVWCTGHNSLTELVSVFTYYSHCGYLAEAGGKIRATNGNTSYGNFGCVAEGYDTTEIPIAGTVNNRNQAAQIVSAFIGEATNKFLRLEFSNAGQNYTGATFAFSGSGLGAIAVADEYRDGGIYEARITGTDYEAGGLGYITSANQAQAGNTQTITLASNDQKTFDNYYGMRLIITSGTGVGQYGYIAYYNAVSKVATIAKESVAAITSSATSSVNNTIAVSSTAGLSVGSPVVMVPNQQVTTAYNTVHTVAVMTTAYISGTTLFVISMGAGAIAPGMTLSGAGIPSNIYIVRNLSGTGSGSTWLINVSQTIGSSGSPITITGTNNLVTLTSSNNMTIGEQIVFTGTTFGGITASTTYYIYNILGNQVVLTATYGGTPLAVSNATGSMTATAGGMLGGLTAGQVYYVIASNFGQSAFSVSTSLGGSIVPVTTQTYGTTMQIHAIGWENLIAGTPAVALLDSTSVYSVEPCVRFTSPTFSSTSSVLPTSANWTGVAYGAGKYVAVSNTGTTAYTANGQTWSLGTALTNALYTDIAYGNNLFVAVASGSTNAAYSATGTAWTQSVTPSSSGYNAVGYGNNRFIAVQTNSLVAASTTDGSSWNAINLPISASWSGIAYGTIGTWVMVSGSNSNVALYSINDGSTWTQVAMPSSANWASVTWGNGRFVAIASGSTTAAYSFDGITWIASTTQAGAAWTAVRYGQGVFLAIASGTSTAMTSADGVTWTTRTLANTVNWSDIAFGNPSSTPGWVAISTTSSSTASYIKAGATALGRAVVANNKITVIKIWEPGSGYTGTPLPTLQVTDPNPTSAVVTLCRVGNGVLGNPTFTNRGSGYRTSTTVVTVSTGDGFADIYQNSKYLTVSGLASLPTPGAALTITGNPNQYRIVVINDLGNGTANFQVSPPLTIALAPEHNTAISIRQKYSQCRITGHDFLLIGTGNQTTSNYPNVDVNTALKYQQIAENNGGRVFQTSTDQDGNFKVGNLFAVEQASGIVTISADQLSLTGLQTLSLGGFSLGTNTVVINQFSTDSYFTANSDTIVPTQRAIKSYVARNIAGGGSNAQAGAVVAGTFGVGGPNKIYSSTQTQLYARNSMNLKKGINGTMLSKSFFAAGFKTGG
jgi:hypothetical protein